MSLLSTIRPLGSGNATVPGGTPILDTQAFVAGSVKGLGNGSFDSGTTAFDLSAIGAVNVAPELIPSTKTDVDLSENALTNTDALLAAQAALTGLSTGTIDLSAGLSAVPIADVQALFAAWTFQVQLDSGSATWEAAADLPGTTSPVLTIVLNAIDPISLSSYSLASGGAFIYVGTSVSSLAASAAKIAQLINENMTGVTALADDAANVGSLTSVTITLADPTLYPTGFYSTTISGGTTVAFQPGQTFVESGYITTLVAAGRTVTVNEYVNRISGATEPVTYAP